MDKSNWREIIKAKGKLTSIPKLDLDIRPTPKRPKDNSCNNCRGRICQLNIDVIPGESRGQTVDCHGDRNRVAERYLSRTHDQSGIGSSNRNRRCA